jgi:hypothetical protein
MQCDRGTARVRQVENVLTKKKKEKKEENPYLVE